MLGNPEATAQAVKELIEQLPKYLDIHPDTADYVRWRESVRSTVRRCSYFAPELAERVLTAEPSLTLSDLQRGPGQISEIPESHRLYLEKLKGSLYALHDEIWRRAKELAQSSQVTAMRECLSNLTELVDHNRSDSFYGLALDAQEGFGGPRANPFSVPFERFLDAGDRVFSFLGLLASLGGGGQPRCRADGLQ